MRLEPTPRVTTAPPHPTHRGTKVCPPHLKHVHTTTRTAKHTTQEVTYTESLEPTPRTATTPTLRHQKSSRPSVEFRSIISAVDRPCIGCLHHYKSIVYLVFISYKSTVYQIFLLPLIDQIVTGLRGVFQTDKQSIYGWVF